MIEKLGKYEILEKIGVGGFGTVYRGRDPFIKRTVAIKTCQSDEEEIKKRFFREAELCGNLHHRNITTIYDFGIQDGVPYIVQELLTGEDLDKLIKRGHPISLQRKVEILIDVCEGLSYAHESGIIHRDMKPSNIRILEDGTVKIMDFGIAKSFQTESNLTQTGITLGTAAYLAPEQIRGEAVDPRTDIFSMGVLSYELMVYQKPFRGEHISTVLFKILNETPESLSTLSPDIPPELDATIHKAMEKGADQRYDTVVQYRNDLAAVKKGFRAGDMTGMTISAPAREISSAGAGVTPPSGALARSPAAVPPDRTPVSGSGALKTDAVSLELLQFQEGGAETAAPAALPASSSSKTGLFVGIAVAVLAAAGAAFYFLQIRPASKTAPPPAAAAAAPNVPPPPAPPEQAPTASEQAKAPAPAEAPAPAAPAPVERYAVKFTSTPVATLYVDGKELGETVPARTIKLDEGKHRVVLEMEDGSKHEEELSVGKNGKDSVFYAFPVGSLLLTASPDWRGAKVLMDGKVRGQIPLSGALLAAPGPHKIKIEKEGEEPVIKPVTIEQGQRSELLIPPPGAGR